MKTLYKCSIVLILLSLAACSLSVATTQPISAPQSTETVVLPPTPAPTYTPTSAVLNVEQKVEAYLNGKLNDIGELSAEDFTQFSASVTERLSLQRGTNPNIYNNEAYLSPDTLKMMKVEDGTTAEQKTIEMFVPISKDAEGNLMVKDPNGEWVTIKNSAGFDWNMVVTNSDDSRIELPTYTDNGVNVVARNLDHINPNTGKDDYALSPLIVYDKSLGQIYFDGANGHTSLTRSILSFLKIETDQAGHPIYGRPVLGVQATSSLYGEGSDKVLMNPGVMREGYPFLNALSTEQIYYVMVDIDQQDAFNLKLFVSLDSWSGFVPAATIYDVLTGVATNNTDLLLVDFYDMIAKK